MDEQPSEIPLIDEVARRLDLITATPGAVLKYDANGDGVLDKYEWEVLRSLVEAEVVRERSGEDPEEDDWSVEEMVEDPHVDLPVMEVLDARYEVLRLIGRGSQGKTLLARTRDDQEYVAIKELAFANLENWKSLELFEREVEVLRGLDHERIPSFVDSFRVDVEHEPPRFFLVQSFIPGSTLDALLASRERISEQQVVEFALGVLEILDYLHTQVPPIIHRDVKPSNLIKTSDGLYTLVDFGGAQVVVASDVGGSTIIGTTGYMPPEQLTGRACPQSDLYALGATMVHLVTHIAPSDLPTSRLKLAWKDRASLAPPLLGFIDRLIEPVVEDRFLSAKDAIRELRMVAQGPTALAIAQPEAIDSLAKRRADFLIGVQLPPEIRGRKSIEDDMIVFDLSGRTAQAVWITGVFITLASLPLLAYVTIPALIVAMCGLAVVVVGRNVSHEELRVATNGAFEVRRGDPLKLVTEGTIQDIASGGNHIRLKTSNGEHLVGEFVEPSVRAWLQQELVRDLAPARALT